MADKKRKISDEQIQLLLEKVDELQDYNLVIDWALNQLGIEIAYSTLAKYYNKSGKKLGRKSKCK